MLKKESAKDPDVYDYWPHCKKVLNNKAKPILAEMK